MNFVLENFLRACQERVANIFSLYLKNSAATNLSAAMNYSVMNGGKRIRPLLVYATGLSLEAPWENLDAPAAAVEFIHAYSLIHDDLPAMDNADLRRGKPSCHKAYSEALAILAGDALQPLAFEILASHPSSHSTDDRLLMIQTLCHASGYQGMVAGQTMDIEGTNTLDQLLQVYSLKTGALLKTSVVLGAIAAKASQSLCMTLTKYGECLGLAFQLQDDLLDIESNATTTGKPHQLDQQNKKNTYPLMVGVEATRYKIQELIDESVQIIECLGKKADILRNIANYILHRKK